MKNYTEPNFQSSAAITIDTQRDTLDGQPFEIPGTSAILQKMKMVLDAYREKGLPVVHIVRIYQRDGGNVDLCRKAAVENGERLFLENSRGCEPAAEILHRPARLDAELLLSGGIQRISESEVIIYKPRWGAFYNTPLESHLKKLGVDTLVFLGCNFPNCPRASIYEASERDYKIALAEDGISGFYPKGIEEMLHIGATVTGAEDICRKVMKLSPLVRTNEPLQ